ncbi:hypothetical protein N781_04690 [Pontibacillus halophilus JSM 076056 = DSM 19796]|uniref:Arginine utilization protein RocB n=1 Tax=Pontibacillus halophilus JSM 076056 = DSM 19796 TaxID=1385510 RepID=A0A0A5GDS2_9BACI|nr:M20/M25/M40 family metallo-hydrolase [Pontibacillus halophilus]KGX91361.1 hypothetical protein N781_04690 [Pontibacillus halophilus JSM 076056 = DSM 19796]
MKWQTKVALKELVTTLVEYPSITGSPDEVAFPEHVKSLLDEFPYFKDHPEYVQTHPLKDGRQLLTALVKRGEEKKTVILLSHFDVVGVEDYGTLEKVAFHPRELTKEMYETKETLPPQVQQDLAKGDWLFGRGAMDMKSGLALHLSMVERAIEGAFDGNILLLTVPDEEVNSLGMLTALDVLKQLKQEEGLSYTACLNGEPMFSQYPGDPNYYVYSGSIGKLLPGFLSYGKETHVGEPFAGLNPNLMVGYLAEELELNETFVEHRDGESTPPPVSLMQRDLKVEYSVQTPQAAVSMYNVMYMRQSLTEINNKLRKAAERASLKIKAHYEQKASAFLSGRPELKLPNMSVRVYTYDELYQEAVERHGDFEVERRQNLLMSLREGGDRDFSTQLVYEVASLCKDLAPMIVLFYSPPFYPSVSSKDDPYIRGTLQHVMERAEQEGITLKEIEYFSGLSDLSFIGPASSPSSLDALLHNMPLSGKGFSLSEELLQAFQMPILNVGPHGKDAHQWTERLEMDYSFTVLPNLVSETIQKLLVS